MRFLRPFALATACLVVSGLGSPLDTLAQPSSTREGVVIRTHWPDVVYETDGAMHDPELRAAEQFTDTAVLPFLDTLAVSYAYSVRDELPIIDFALRWVPAGPGILDGRPVSSDAMPKSIELALVDLSARVFVHGEPVGTLLLTLDSLAVPASPYRYVFETAGVQWDDVFADVAEPGARRAFSEGFELRDLDVLRIGFESFEPDPVDQRTKDVPVVRRQPRRRAIFVPNVNIWLGWDIGRDPYGGRPSRASGTYRPRGDEIGRSDGSGERRQRGGARAVTPPKSNEKEPASARQAGRAAAAAAGKTKEDKKDDDDRDLIGPALAGVAAVGALAYLGGTVGYFGDPVDAPLGLQSGRVTARGGLLLHAAVSPDVLSGGPDERLLVGMTVFMRPVLGRLHPTLGLDVWLEDDGTRRTGDPTVTVGALLRTKGPLVVNVGIDVIEQRLQFGFAFNMRWKQLAR